jgi:hypothetical protein
MPHEGLVSDAARITWRHPYLWLLGLLGGGGGLLFTSVYLHQGPVSDPDLPTLALAALIEGLQLVYTIVAFLVSCVAGGALVRAAAEHDAGRPFRLGWAVQAGLRAFPAVLVVQLPVLVAGTIGLTALGLVVLLVIAAMRAMDTVGTLLTIVVGLNLLLGLLGVVVAASLLVTLASRAVVLEQRGPLRALARAWSLLGRHPSSLIIAWLVAALLALLPGLVLSVFESLTSGLVNPIGDVYVNFGTGAIDASAGGVVFGDVVAVLSGALGTYFGVYWTLVFRRLQAATPA